MPVGAAPSLVCAATEPRLLPLRLATAAMGTRFELVLGGADPDRLRPVGEAAIGIIEESHRRLSRFAPDSLVSHINRTAFAHAVRLDGDTFDLFADALAVQHATDGAFDIAVAGARCRSGGVLLDGRARTIRFTRADVAIDLGAIAKGHALDLAARVLREHGVSCALLHGGTSSVGAVGAPPGMAGWRIALGRSAGARSIVLRDAALSVSGPAGPRDRDGHALRPGHIVDPRSGKSVPGTHLIAVKGPSARLADAWSTAITVLGRRPPSLGPAWTMVRIEAA